METPENIEDAISEIDKRLTEMHKNHNTVEEEYNKLKLDETDLRIQISEINKKKINLRPNLQKSRHNINNLEDEKKRMLRQYYRESRRLG